MMMTEHSRTPRAEQALIEAELRKVEELEERLAGLVGIPEDTRNKIATVLEETKQRLTQGTCSVDVANMQASSLLLLEGAMNKMCRHVRTQSN